MSKNQRDTGIMNQTVMKRKYTFAKSNKVLHIVLKMIRNMFINDHFSTSNEPKYIRMIRNEQTAQKSLVKQCVYKRTSETKSNKSKPLETRNCSCTITIVLPKVSNHEQIQDKILQNERRQLTSTEMMIMIAKKIAISIANKVQARNARLAKPITPSYAS